ncbi:MAG: hypothetical protein NC397_09360 [Clostridium sp.]|nr:hypothetical protein [Clostridium sp.]
MAFIREQKIKSGEIMEINFFPVHESGRRVSERAPKTRPSSEKQKKANKKNAMMHLFRLVHANFDNRDFWCHFTYRPENAPKNRDEAFNDFYNYIKKVRRYRRKHGLGEMIYICVPEEETYKTGKYAGKTNYHFHFWMTGRGLSRDMAEDMWTPRGQKNNRVEADRFMPERFGYEAAVKYVQKAPVGAKRYYPSKNLKKPEYPKPIDGKTSRLDVERMAKIHTGDRAYWENRYEEYEYVTDKPKYNKYNGYWYTSVIMVKKINPQSRRRVYQANTR